MMSEERESTSDKKDGIKPSQVTAAALAAVTAAFLGSTLGVAGTVAGAGIASVVSTVGGELYLRSLSKTKEAAQRTKEAALALADSSTRQQADLSTQQQADPSARQQADPSAQQLNPSTQQQVNPGTQQVSPSTRHLTGPVQQPRPVPGQRYHPTAQRWAGRPNHMRPGPGAGPQPPWGRRHPAHSGMPGTGAGQPVDADATVAIPQLNRQSPVKAAGAGKERIGSRYGLRWPLIIGTSVVGFGIAIVAITGFEGATGKSISGDHVTTVGHIWEGVGGGQPDNPPTSGDDEKVQPTQSRVPTTTTGQNSSDGKKQPTSSSAPSSTSVPKSSTSSTGTPKSSTSSTGAPESSTPSTTVPESSNTPRTQSSPSNNSNAPGGGSQRSGSEGSAGVR